MTQDEDKPVEALDVEKRQCQKKAARDEDARALAAGEKPQEHLRRENGMFYSMRFKIDLSKVKA